MDIVVHYMLLGLGLLAWGAEAAWFDGNRGL